MIIEVNPNKKNKICSPVIGFEAENKVTGFEFDYSDWAADIGDGYLTLSVKRPTDTIPYPVSLTQTGTHKATWTVSSTDVAFAGRGEVQLTYIVDDKVKKSAIYEILIDRSLEPDGDIPDPYISWFEELLQVSVQVEADADRAEAAADSIKNLEAVAVTLPSGESATAEYDPETGVMSFGIPKGDTGDVGPTGNGISSTVLNADYTLTINFTDGTSYTTPSIRGEQGIQGETGNGIASTVLNPDYTLTITFTDGTTYTTPSIRGPEGAQGQTGPTGNGIDNVTMDASGYLTITFTDGSTWTSPTSLIGPVKDVKVNGESVVDENGVANITVPIITKTVSGNPIVVDDADGAVQALDVELLPVQDLHGYDKPWSAGAGKNKLNPDYSAWDSTGTYLHINNVVGSNVNACLTFVDKDTSVSLAGISMGWVYDDVGSTSASYYRWCILNGTKASNTTNESNNVDNPHMICSNIFVYPNTQEAFNKLFARYYIQAELGTTSTSYAPYENECPITGRTQTEITDTDGDTQSHTTTVTLPHTVYGADVDVTGGEGKEKYAIVDLGTLSWGYSSADARFYYTGIPYKRPTSGNIKANAICTAYPIVAFGSLTDKSIALYSNGYIYAKDSAYTDATTFKNSLSGVMLCYELADYTDLTTTPTDVELYKGDNVVSGDGTMTLTYVRNLQMVIDKIESAL